MSDPEQLQSEIVNTDVLVLGGGIAGCFAAIRAKESGSDVVLVDKGHLGRSSTSNQISGVLTYFDPEKDDYDKWYRECIEASQWLADQKRLEGMIYKTTDRIMDLNSWGVEFQKENGEFMRKPGVGHYYARNAYLTYGGFQLMSVMRGEVLRRGVRVIERVMTTDFLTSDGETLTSGRVIGATGFNIRNGKFYVFRAKAIIIVTGASYAVHSKLQKPNLSGDGKAMAFRTGCEMRNVELSLFSYSPRDFSCSPGANSLFGNGAILVNANGERFMQRWDELRMERAPRAVTCQAMAMEEYEGRGPVYLDATHLGEEAHHIIEQAIPIVISSFAAGGLSLRKDKIPYTVALTDHGPGGIRADKDGATNIPGLYAAGAASDHGEHGVSNVIGGAMASAIGGHRAGESSAKYARQIGEPTINESQLRLIKEQTFVPMKRQTGISHREVLGHIMQVWNSGVLGPIRNEKGLKKALEAVQEIRDNDIPNLVAREYHELARAIGVSNGLLLLELIPRCALLRTESRGSHYRVDYSERDDVNWLKWVVAKREDNNIRVWAESIPWDEYPVRPGE